MKIDQDVMEVLSGLAFDGDKARIEKQLDRKMYLKVNKILAALGGKWTRKAKAHVFPGSAEEIVDAAIVAGEVTTRRETGFFPTPKLLAEQLVAMADVQPGHTCLEPSAGTGRIVEALLGASPKLVVAVERDPEMREALQRYGGKVLVTEFPDFMSMPAPGGGYDRVVMNPPFVRSGMGDHLDHVWHAYRMLNNGGVLVSVLPSGVVFRQDRRHREFREWAKERGVIDGLPPLSFRESGTDVHTCTLKLEKRGD